jgi:hypothetical protein
MFTERTDAMKILYALLKVSSSKHEIATCQHVRELMAQLVGRRTRDREVWGSIPQLVKLGKLLILHCLWPPCSNGYLVHESKVGSILLLLPCGLHRTRGVKSPLKMRVR